MGASRFYPRARVLTVSRHWASGIAMSPLLREVREIAQSLGLTAKDLAAGSSLVDRLNL
jgi:hypothetical protein